MFIKRILKPYFIKFREFLKICRDLKRVSKRDVQMMCENGDYNRTVGY